MMHPQFRIDTLHQQARRLELDTQRSALLAKSPKLAPLLDESVALRLCSVHDDAALERLAMLDGQAAPRGRYVLAEVNGEVVAALPLRGGEPIANPFRRTGHLLPLLRLRATQLQDALADPRDGRLGWVGRLNPHRGRT
jgi:hypothetical protein